MTIRAIDNRVLVEPLEAQSSDKGIIIPDIAKGKPTRGKVLSVGPGRMNPKGIRDVIGCEVGDTVVFNQYGGVPIEVDGQKLMIVRSPDLLAVESV